MMSGTTLCPVCNNGEMNVCIWQEKKYNVCFSCRTIFSFESPVKVGELEIITVKPKQYRMKFLPEEYSDE